MKDTVDIGSYDPPSIPHLLSEIRDILADIRTNGGSLSSAEPEDGVPSVRDGDVVIREVSVPDPDNERLTALVFELANLLDQWRHAPIFTDVAAYGAWLQSIGPLVDAAIEKVEGGPVQDQTVDGDVSVKRKPKIALDDEVGPMGVYIRPKIKPRRKKQ